MVKINFFFFQNGLKRSVKLWKMVFILPDHVKYILFLSFCLDIFFLLAPKIEVEWYMVKYKFNIKQKAGRNDLTMNYACVGFQRLL